MKTPFATLALIGAVLMAGSALAQTAPRGPAPRSGTTPSPAVGSVPPGQPQGQTRGTGVGGTAPDRAEASINTSGGTLAIEASVRQSGPTTVPAAPAGIGGSYDIGGATAPGAVAVGTVQAGQPQGQTRGAGVGTPVPPVAPTPPIRTP